MSVSFSAEKAWKVQQVGDLVRSYHWVNDEPAMVLYPVRAKEGAGAYVICLSSAFQYDDMKYLVRQAAIAAGVMGMSETRASIYRIGTVIHDGLLDLIKQPPEPQWRKAMDRGAVIGQLEVKKDGKIMIERDVYEGDRGNVRG